MTDYLFVFRGGLRADNEDVAPEVLAAHMAKWQAWAEALTKSGHLKAGQPLVSSGRSVRGADKVVTDGPYAEAKDLVAGFMAIVAADLDEATALAQGCPGLAEGGSVEVRPVLKRHV